AFCCQCSCFAAAVGQPLVFDVSGAADERAPTLASQTGLEAYAEFGIERECARSCVAVTTNAIIRPITTKTSRSYGAPCNTFGCGACAKTGTTDVGAAGALALIRKVITCLSANLKSEGMNAGM
ncbi:MAG TPA: hypothetical protein DCF97_02660, partial [Plesiomonas shigelloides]|nr:hypothetical protein [Plesiomonas shigelloides]